MADNIEEGLGGINSLARDLARGVDNGTASLEKFNRLVVANKGDLAATLKTVMAMNSQIKAGHQNWSAVARVAEELKDGSAAWVTNLKNITGGTRDLGSAFKKLAAETGEVADNANKHLEAVDKIKDLLKETVKQGSAYGKRLKDIEKQEASILKELTEYGEKQKDVAKIKEEMTANQKKLIDLQKDSSGETAEQRTMLEEMLKVDEDRLKQAEEHLGISAEMAKNYVEQLDHLKSQREEAERIQKAMAEWEVAGKNGLAGVAKHAKGLFSGLTKASPQELKDRQARFKELGAMGKTRGGAGGAAMQAAGGVGQAATGMLMKAALPMAIAGAVVSVLKQVIGFIFASDELVKKYNKGFQELTGAVFDGAQFKKQAKVYGDTIHDAERNWGLGVLASEWEGMYKAMSSGGRSINNYTNSLKDMGKVQRTVRSASLMMGMSLEDGGRIMQEMSQEFSSPIEKIAEEFNKVAGSAKHAGLQAGHFLNIVNQSTLSLAAYGKFTEVAAGALLKFTKSQAVGDKTAAAAEGQMMSFFGDDMAQNMGKLGLAQSGGFNIKEAWEAEIGKREEQLSKTTVGSDEWKRLRADIATMTNVRNAENPEMAMAQNAKFLSGQVGDVIKGIMSTYGVKGGINLAERGALLKDQIPPELLITLTKTQSQLIAGLKDVKSSLSAGTAGSDELKEFLSSGEVGKLLDKGGLDSYEKLYKMLDSMKGVKAESRESIKQLMDSPEQMKKLMKHVQAGGSLTESYMADLALEAATSTQGPKMSTKVTEQAAQIDAVTELSKRAKISEEAAKWALAQSSPMQSMVALLQGILEGVNKIVGYVSKMDPSTWFAKQEILATDTEEEAAAKKSSNRWAEAKSIAMHAMGGTPGMVYYGAKKISQAFTDDPKEPAKDNGGMIAKTGYYKGHAGELVLRRYETNKLTNWIQSLEPLKVSSTAGAANSAPVRVANVTNNITGVSGEDVVAIIEKKWNTAKYWEGTGRA